MTAGRIRSATVTAPLEWPVGAAISFRFGEPCALGGGLPFSRSGANAICLAVQPAGRSAGAPLRILQRTPRLIAADADRADCSVCVSHSGISFARCIPGALTFQALRT